MATLCCSPPESCAGKFFSSVLQAPPCASTSAASSGVAADLGCQLHVFKGGKVLHQVVKLEYKSNIIPPVGSQLAPWVGGYLLAVDKHPAACKAVHAAEYI